MKNTLTQKDISYFMIQTLSIGLAVYYAINHKIDIPSSLAVILLSTLICTTRVKIRIDSRTSRLSSQLITCLNIATIIVLVGSAIGFINSIVKYSPELAFLAIGGLYIHLGIIDYISDKYSLKP